MNESDFNTTSWSKEKVLDKVKKLLNLSKSDNAGEAGAALSRAQYLMAKFGLAISEVEETKEDIVENTVNMNTKSISTYQYLLASRLADHFGCEVLRVHFGIGNASSLSFIGEPIKVETLEQCFKFAYKAYQKSSARYLKIHCDGMSRSEKLRERYDYFFGFIDGLTNELIRSENEHALVVVKSEALENHMNSMNISHITLHRKETSSVNASLNGYTDGSYAYRNKNKGIDSAN